MDFSSWITVIGTVASLASMAVAIRQARNAFKSSNDAKKAMATVQLAAVAERLKSAQEHIRDLAPDKVTERGFKSGSKIDSVRREFDTAMSALPTSGVGSSARVLLSNAQASLNEYYSSLHQEPNLDEWQTSQKLVQDTISNLTSTASIQGINS
ncbi:hypothetical protein EBB79_07220 [Parasedimentitalea marina]|uniref:Uncharacterized protein n=2 Tax=Parasedimentitalea marina TaxID=2483033 RepID=A0A3T0N134_9RHOB|nr:hypothetical protein EBB79_07220 [Parasedimentitalea marina]